MRAMWSQKPFLPGNRNQSEQMERVDLEHFPSMVENSVPTSGGLKLKMKTIFGKPKSKVMLLAPAIGFSVSVFRPIIAQFGDEFTYITWDYRGMYDSDEPRNTDSFSVKDHADDAMQVLKATGRQHAHVLVGYSMGVQVCLEVALRYPNKCGSLVLINGTYGEALKTRIPVVGMPVNWAVDCLLDKFSQENDHGRNLLRLGKKIVDSSYAKSILRMYSDIKGNKTWQSFGDKGYISNIISDIASRLTKDEKTSRNYFRLLKELNQHNIGDSLAKIKTPALLISGGLDFVTPSYLMDTIGRKMQNSTLAKDAWSSHYTLIQNPEFVVGAMKDFLSKQKLNRMSNGWRYYVECDPFPSIKHKPDEKNNQCDAKKLTGLMCLLEEDKLTSFFRDRFNITIGPRNLPANMLLFKRPIVKRKSAPI